MTDFRLPKPSAADGFPYGSRFRSSQDARLIVEVVVIIVLWLKLVIEAIGALVIGFGMVLATLRFLRGSSVPGRVRCGGPHLFRGIFCHRRDRRWTRLAGRAFVPAGPTTG